MASVTTSRITVKPDKWAANPVFEVCFTVYDLAAYLASGMTEEQILEDFPYLEKEDFRAVYEFFANLHDRMLVKLLVDENLEVERVVRANAVRFTELNVHPHRSLLILR